MTLLLLIKKYGAIRINLILYKERTYFLLMLLLLQLTKVVIITLKQCIVFINVEGNTHAVDHEILPDLINDI